MIDRDSFIKQIAHELKRRPLSLFLGAGIGADANLPTWNELFESLKKDLDIEKRAEISKPMLAQYYANEYASGLEEKVQREIHVPHNRISSLLASALSLGPTNIWSLNYDTVAEHTLSAEGLQYSVFHNERNLGIQSSSEVINLYKIGGDISSLTDALITRDSFEKYPDRHILFETFLRKELVTNTFLFLGYSFEDGIVQKSLAQIVEILGANANYHYTMMREDRQSPRAQAFFIKDLEKRYHVRTLLVKEYAEEKEILQNILEETLKDKVFISGSLWNPEQVRGQNPYQVSKAVSLALLEEGKTIVSGLGYNVGYYVSGAVSEYCLQRGLKYSNHMLLMPYSHDCTDEKQQQWRASLIAQSHAVIFLYGQVNRDGNPTVSNGVMEEFELARKLNKPIVPLGSTGFAAARILDHVISEPYKYEYLNLTKFQQALMNETNPEKIGKLVRYIIKNIDEM